MTAKRAAGLVGVMATLLAFSAQVAVAQSITSFSIKPAMPTTGDPVTLTAELALPEDCLWEETTVISFGPQEELGPGEGWAIDVRLTRTLEVCLQVPIDLSIDAALGTLPLASGPGVLRLFEDGVVADTALFDLEVVPGPAPGWTQMARHGGFNIIVLSASLTAVGDLLAMGDLSFPREIFLFDPRIQTEITAFGAPGSGDVRALAFDGTNLFASVAEIFGGPRIYVVGLQGQIIDSFASPTVLPGSLPLEGLAVHQGVLYGSHPSPPTLFAIDPESHQMLWHRSLPDRILGMAPVPTGLLGIVPTGTLYFIEPAPDGEEIVLADPVDLGISVMQEFVGLAFDGFGAFVWDRQHIQLRFLRTLALWWARDGTLRMYVPEGGLSVDILRGSVAGLRQLAFNVDLGPTTCLVCDGSGGTVPPDGDPPPGEAYLYLARFRSVDGFNTSYGRSSLGLRRIDLDGSCP